MQHRDEGIGGGVEHVRADVALWSELELIRSAEERLVFPNWLSLIVEDRPAGANPSGADVGSSVDERPRLGLDFLLDFAYEAGGISERVLVKRCLPVSEIRGGGRARQRVDHERRGLRAVASAVVRVEIVEQPRRRVAQDAQRIGEWIREMREDRGVVEVGKETGERVAEGLAHLAHDGGASDKPERVEGHLTTITIGIADQVRQKHAIVIGHLRRVADRVNGRRWEEIICRADTADSAE